MDDPDYGDAVAAGRCRSGRRVWVRLHDPDEADQMPKVDHYAGLVFVALKAVLYAPDDGSDGRDGTVVESGEMTVFVGEHFASIHRSMRVAGRRGNPEMPF